MTIISLVWLILNFLCFRWTLIITRLFYFWLFRSSFSTHSWITVLFRFICTICWSIFLSSFIYVFQFVFLKWYFTIISYPSLFTISITSWLTFSAFSVDTQTFNDIFRLFRIFSNLFYFCFELIILCHNISCLLHRRFLPNLTWL